MTEFLSDKKIFMAVCRLVFYLAVFLASFLLLGRYFPQLELDPSWSAVLEYAFEKNWLYGRDIIFTYGPLGFLNATHSQGHLISYRFLFAIVWSVTVTISVVGVSRLLNPPFRIIFIFWFFLFSYSGCIEQHAYLVIAFGFLLILFSDIPSRWFLYLFVPMLVILSLVKFTFFVAVSAALVVCFFVKTIEKKICYAVGMPLLFSALFIIFWLVSGQQLQYMPNWLKGSWEVSSGYSMAMSILPPLTLVLIPLAALLLFFSAFAASCFFNRKNISAVGFLLVVALTVFFIWKHGNVRSDHLPIFLASFPLQSILLMIKPLNQYSAKRSWFLAPACLLSILICLAGFEYQSRGSVANKARSTFRRLSENINFAVNAVAGRMDKVFESVKQKPLNENSDLSLTRSIVGNSKVDVMNYLQWGAIGNNLNYLSRPVIQGYSAYTPYLMELNEQHYLGNERPDYVMYSQETIDERFPALDDSQAVNTVLYNYFPVARDRKFLILKQSRSKSPQYKKLHQQRVKFGEKIDVSRWGAKPVFMTVDMSLSLSGSLTNLLYQLPPLFVELSTGGNETKRFRFIPKMGERPFLLSPILNNTDDIVDLYAGTSEISVKSIKFSRDISHLISGDNFNSIKFSQDISHLFFEDNFTITFYGVDDFPCSDGGKSDKKILSNFKRAPIEGKIIRRSSTQPLQNVEFKGESALMVHADGIVEIEIPEGSKSFNGFYGILEGAYTGSTKTDGVVFSIYLIDKQGRFSLAAARHLRPAAQSADRGKQNFEIPLDSSKHRRILLNTDSGPKRNMDCDWSVWGNCKFK